MARKKMQGEINFKAMEKKWQREWSKKKIFEVKEEKRKKYYVLDMFPYPSAEGLHIGHAFVFSLGDIFARFKRLQGYNVLYPVGYDSLGLPAENAAIKAGVHPRDYTKNSIKNFMRQQKAMGWSYDWSRLVNTSNPDYYKWDQWIFLKMLEKGLAFRKKSAVNYCKKCQTVLANEQVVNGKCWRHEDTEVKIKHLEQWFFKITKYADELLEGLKKINWPERAKIMQRNWIGKSYGTEIDFLVEGKIWKIFTTRPDTIFGVTFMVISSQHHKLFDLVTEKQKKEVQKFMKKLKSVSEKELENMDKEGVFTGSYAINPVNNEKIPIWAGNFVVADYGSGMVMAVPGHDSRDYEFAKKYKLPIKEVISGGNIKERAYVDKGKIVNSKQFNGLDSEEAKEKISEYLEKKKLGRKKVEYKLKDWLISRQRYWGTPIPIVYCNNCGIVPVPEEDLPVKLPEKIKFGKGNPLTTNEKWIKVKCPKCKGKGRRETDTMDTFVNSSWYYLRYTDSKNSKEIFDKKKANYWCPIDQYIGGPEHITMHLIYLRFYTKFLRDLGFLKFDEPALRYFTQGIVHGSDGEKMSKSRGNIVEPLEIIEKYGADTLRLALVSFGSPDSDISWDEKIITGSKRFLERVFVYFLNLKKGKSDKLVESRMNKLIKDVGEDIEKFRHNLAIIKLKEFFNYVFDKSIDKNITGKFLVMLSPFCPHITEELWHKLGNRSFISLEKWPVPGKIDKKLLKEEEQIEKLIEDIKNIMKILEQRGEKKKEKIKIFAIPNELAIYKKEEGKLARIFSMNIEVLNIKDASRTGKVIKASPGKPGILIE